jgi:hypothetical protein
LIILLNETACSCSIYKQAISPLNKGVDYFVTRPVERKVLRLVSDYPKLVPKEDGCVRINDITRNVMEN